MSFNFCVLSFQGRSSLHLTHVTFSPNGEEVLISYSAEHVYLMDVNHGMPSPLDTLTSNAVIDHVSLLFCLLP